MYTQGSFYYRSGIGVSVLESGIMFHFLVFRKKDLLTWYVRPSVVHAI